MPFFSTHELDFDLLVTVLAFVWCLSKSIWRFRRQSSYVPGCSDQGRIGGPRDVSLNGQTWATGCQRPQEIWFPAKKMKKRQRCIVVAVTTCVLLPKSKVNKNIQKLWVTPCCPYGYRLRSHPVLDACWAGPRRVWLHWPSVQWSQRWRTCAESQWLGGLVYTTSNCLVVDLNHH